MNELKDLLQNFLIEKISKYQEPERKGTPKGDPIGLSVLKYQATLFLLYDLTLKEIADELKMSYGLLRKWRTESSFNELVRKHMDEFSELFLDRLSIVIDEDEKFHDQYIKRTSIDKLERGTRITFPALYHDMNHYSLGLRTFIANKILSSHLHNVPVTLWLLKIIDFWIDQPAKGQKRGKPNKELARTVAEEKQALKKRLLKSMLDDVIMVLAKENITEEERKQAIFRLTTVKTDYE
jgi:hypothetical protein